MKTSYRAFAVAALTLAFGVAAAKLPPPAPLTDAQKAAAEEKKAKDAAAATLATQQLEKSMDRAAANYFADMKAKGKYAPAAQLGSMAAATPVKAPAGKPAPAAAPAKK